MNIGDKDRVVVAEVIARAWQDAAFRNQLVTQPEKVLREAGMDLPAGTKVHVVENSDNVTYAVFPEGDFQKFKPAVMTALENTLPLNPGHEVRVVQNSPGTLYLTLPKPPAGMGTGKLSDAELAAVAGGGSAYLVEGVAVATSANVAAEANVAAAANVAGATEAVAVAVGAIVLV